MRKGVVVWVGVLLCAGPLSASEPKEKAVLESWDTAYLETGKAGYVHTLVREVEEGGRTLYRSSLELHLTVKRFNDTVQLRMESGCDEDADGKVTAVSMKQHLGKDQQLVLTGTVVEGPALQVKVREVRGGVSTPRLERKIPWDAEVVGLYHQERIFRERKVKPGDRFTYRSFEPTVNAVITTRVTVKDYEEVSLGEGKRRLLRVEAVPDKLDAQNASIQLPGLTAWLDDERGVVRSEVEMPGLGRLTLYRGTRARATGRGEAVAEIKDIGISQLIAVKTRIPQPYATRDALYRITVRGDEDAASTFARDDRQTVANAAGNSFELRVQAQRGPRPTGEVGQAGPEYLKSSYFINSDDAAVRSAAAEAVGGETDPWKKAQRVERWVHQKMRNTNFTEAFATADHVARTLEGDCTEHAVLTAALCRAAGVPSRTAVGLIYVDGSRGPSFGFHMWTEVWVQGQWLPLDATLGRGYVGATHLKIADHSWHDVQSLTPLLPVVRVVGKLSIEVLRAN